ncbi:MAG: MarR family transcriptional regulator [Actinomycetota bacterium]
MLIDKPLDDLFRSRSHVRVLRTLDELPEGFSVSAREIARRADLSHPTASRALVSLVEHGVVGVRRTPRADLFGLQRDHVAATMLAVVFEWERGLREELLAFLRREIIDRTDSVAEAYLFGSAVRGAMTPKSDIDVAVLCAPAVVEKVTATMHDVGEAVRRRFGNPLSFVVGTADLDQLGRAGRNGYRLWRQIALEGRPILGASSRGHVRG